MKKLQDYMNAADNRLRGMGVSHVPLLGRVPARLLPYTIPFALHVEGTIRLASAKADWIAYAALFAGTLAFAGIIVLINKRKRK